MLPDPKAHTLQYWALHSDYCLGPHLGEGHLHGQGQGNCSKVCTTSVRSGMEASLDTGSRGAGERRFLRQVKRAGAHSKMPHSFKWVLSMVGWIFQVPLFLNTGVPLFPKSGLSKQDKVWVSLDLEKRFPWITQGFISDFQHFTKVEDWANKPLPRTPIPEAGKRAGLGAWSSPPATSLSSPTVVPESPSGNLKVVQNTLETTLQNGFKKQDLWFISNHRWHSKMDFKIRLFPTLPHICEVQWAWDKLLLSPLVLDAWRCVKFHACCVSGTVHLQQ